MRTLQEYEDGILDAFSSVGLFFQAETFRTESIGELIPDSITYISFIIELEQMFEIEIPDDFLFMKNLSTLDNLSKMLQDLSAENELNIIGKEKED